MSFIFQFLFSLFSCFFLYIDDVLSVRLNGEKKNSSPQRNKTAELASIQ